MYCIDLFSAYCSYIIHTVYLNHSMLHPSLAWFMVVLLAFSSNFQDTSILRFGGILKALLKITNLFPHLIDGVSVHFMPKRYGETASPVVLNCNIYWRNQITRTHKKFSIYLYWTMDNDIGIPMKNDLNYYVQKWQ